MTKAEAKKLKQSGDRGTIERLRHALRDSAAIMETMADQLDSPDEGPWRKRFAKALRRGSRHARGLAFFSRPTGRARAAPGPTP